MFHGLAMMNTMDRRQMDQSSLIPASFHWLEAVLGVFTSWRPLD